MFSRIDKLRNLASKTRVRSDEKSEKSSESLFDPHLTFAPSSGEKWTFEENHIYLNGDDVNKIINESSDDITSLTGLSAGLDQYRQHVWSNNGKSLAKYNGTVNALLEKILGRLGNVYYGLVGGIRYEYSDGDLWINDINVRAVLNLYRIRPTRKARCYLAGLKNKLGLILSSQSDRAHSNGIESEAERLLGEISETLEHVTPNDSYISLPSARAC